LTATATSPHLHDDASGLANYSSVARDRKKTTTCHRMNEKFEIDTDIGE